MPSMASEQRSRRPYLKRAIQLALSLVIVFGIFAYAIPRIADYSAVMDTIGDLTPIEFASLFAAMLFNLFTYWVANMAALPGLSLPKSAVVTQTTTSVANTLPAGGAIAVGLTFQILHSWGFSAQAITLYIGVTGVWNIFVKLALPVISLALLALTGQVSAPLVIASLIGLAVLLVAAHGHDDRVAACAMARPAAVPAARGDLGAGGLHAAEPGRVRVRPAAR